MRFQPRFLLIASLLCLPFLSAVPVQAVGGPVTRVTSSVAKPASPTPLYASDHVLVKFRDGVVSADKASVVRAAGGDILRTTRSGYDVVRVPAGQTPEELVRFYADRPDVEAVRQDAVVAATFTPNDPQFSFQWNFDASHINMPAAWNLDTTSPKYGGDPSVVVAVIDTGVAYEDYGPYKKAPDFASTAFTAGYDFVNNDAHPNDDHFHGTHVAMTIAESTNNSVAMSGIAYKTTIMPVKVLDSTGFGLVSEVSDGVLFAVANGADVINMSLGTYVDDPLMSDAIAQAINAGIVVVAAVGNGDAPQSFGGDGVYGTGDPVVLYPAKYSGVIGVGAVRYDRASAPYSNYGSGVDIVAPGGDTSVDQNGDGYGDGILQQTLGDTVDTFASIFLEGTSMASPHVAAAAALLLADGVDSGDVASRLTATAQKDLPSYSSNRHGAGMLDAAAMYVPPQDLTPPSPLQNFTAFGGDKRANLHWDASTASDFASVRVYRKRGSAPTSYGDGTLVYDSTDILFTDTSLTNGSVYYYAAYVLDTSGNHSTVVTATAFPAASTSAARPSLLPGFFATQISSTSNLLVWGAPVGQDLAGVMIRRSTVDFPSGPTDGHEVYRGTGRSFTDPGLLPGKTYFYAGFVYNTHGVFSAPSVAVVTFGSTDETSPGPVTGMRFNAFRDHVRLAWDLPLDLDYAFTMVVRKRGSAPSGPGEGELVYSGYAADMTDTQNIVPGATYYYGLFAVDSSENLSSQATTAAVQLPGPSIIAAPLTAGGPQVREFKQDGAWNGTQFFAYDSAFRGGVHVAAGDIDGDGADEIIVGAGKGGGPQVRVFESDGTAKPIQFFAFLPSFRGGIDVASGDVDGDGKAEIAVCQFSGGQAWVKVYKYNVSKTVLGTWNAFGKPEVGCTVAMGDVDKDGKDEIIVGAGKGGGPQVRVFEADGTPKPIQFFAFNSSFRGGVDVASGDVNGDGRDDVIVSQLSGGQAWVKSYGFTADRPVLGTFNAFGAPEVGATVDAVDLNGDGKAEVIVAAGTGGGPQVRVFRPNGTAFGVNFFAFNPVFRGGVSVGAGIF